MKHGKKLLVEFDKGEFKPKHGNDNLWYVHLDNVKKEGKDE